MSEDPSLSKLWRAAICPRCATPLEYDEVDIGVGIMRGNPGCPNCYWTPPQQSDEKMFDGRDISEWPNCSTPDCENKCCLWSTLPTICFPCGERELGRPAMLTRYKETHNGQDLTNE